MSRHASLLGYRYRIERVYEHARDRTAEAPTIDEAHTWITERIQRAGKVGLHLRPLDFEVVDTWEEQHYSLASCADLVLGQPGAPNYRERYASLPPAEWLPYACPIDGSPPACIYEGKTAREIVASLPARIPDDNYSDWGGHH